MREKQQTTSEQKPKLLHSHLIQWQTRCWFSLVGRLLGCWQLNTSNQPACGVSQMREEKNQGTALAVDLVACPDRLLRRKKGVSSGSAFANCSIQLPGETDTPPTSSAAARPGVTLQRSVRTLSRTHHVSQQRYVL